MNSRYILLLVTVSLLLGYTSVGFAQNSTVNGTVSDAQSGETLPGVNILVEGTTTGTSTDSEGNFELTVESLQDTLVVSFIGYQTQDVPIQGQTEITIELQSQAITGEEMVVVGYGEQKKVNLTGSVSQIGSADLEKRAVNSTTQALQGLSPNLNVTVNGSGGASDATRDINIRGTGSLSSSDPYILIDGVRATQAEFSTLNPNVIENISVLKDAAAAAIYGAHAAYGVILVETKGGAKDQRFLINYSNNFRIEQLVNVPSTVNSVEFARMANLASANYGGQTVYSEEQIAKMQAFIDGELEYGTEADPDNPNLWRGIQQGSSSGWQTGFANTDWWDVMFKDTKTTQEHNVSVSGGSENTTYYLAGGILNDPGQLRYGDSNERYDRYNVNSNVSADITDWFTITNITRFSQTNNSFPNSLSGIGERWRIIHDMNRFSPLTPYKLPPVRDSGGNIIAEEQLAHNAATAENNGFNRYKINNLVTTLEADLDVTSNLSLNADYTYKSRDYDRTYNYKQWRLIGPNGGTSVTYQQNNNQIGKEFQSTDYTSFNVYANYDKTLWADHNLNVLAGYQQEENNFEALETARQSVVNNNYNSTNIAVGNIIGPSNQLSTFATIGAFGRLQYNYKEKYLFEFNGRYDGSSRFASGNRFVFSPSVSVGYNIQEEKFWEPISKYINTFKLRASYGTLGNQEVSSYLYAATIPINTRLAWALGGERPNYTGTPDLISPNITWETSTTINIGADLAFLDNRLSASIDVYERQTDNMFGPQLALPAVLGTSPPQTNSASLKTRGWELSLEWQDQINDDINYNVNVMVSDNLTTITEYNNPSKVISEYYVGQELGEIWGFEADELFQSQQEVDDYLSSVNLSYFGTGWQAGNVKYKDLNGDGEVNIGENTLNNPGDRRVIGNNRPRYQFSVQAGASWKNFDFSMFWQGVGQRDVWLDDYTTLFWGWNRDAHTHIQPASLDHWSEDNPDGYLPIPLAENGRAGFDKDRYPSTRYLQNGAYLRLKSLQLGYSLPVSLIQKINIQNLRVFINGSNLITITDMWPGIDPEIAPIEGGFGSTASGRAYPLSRVFGFGVDISF